MGINPFWKRRRKMTPLDYGRSFLIGKAAANEVRFWVESRTRIIDEKTGKSEDYIQTGACKSEHTFAEKDLLAKDNYDFLPIFGPELGVIFRRKANFDPGYKSCVPTEEMWEGQDYYLVEGSEVVELASNDEIRQATYDFAPIVSQTEIWNEETGLRAIIECPVKTMNTHREGNLYQVDTGPVALPDLSERHERQVDGIRLAFLVFNAPDFADFVIEAPTMVGKAGESCQIHHYSQLLSLPAENRLYSVRS
jgi:hypothetical protein